MQLLEMAATLVVVHTMLKTTFKSKLWLYLAMLVPSFPHK